MPVGAGGPYQAPVWLSSAPPGRRGGHGAKTEPVKGISAYHGFLAGPALGISYGVPLDFVQILSGFNVNPLGSRVEALGISS